MQPMMMNSLTMLEFSYAKALTQDDCPPASRMAFIADAVFDFTTYDDDMAALFAAKGIEICNAISNLETFDFIKKEEDNYWYLLLVNTPFFINRIDWGTSIRGAFWRFDMPPLKSCQLYWGVNQLLEIPFNDTSWMDFVSAIAMFVKDESVCSCPSGDGSLRWPCPSHPPVAAVTLSDAQLDTLRLAAEMLEGNDCEDTAGDLRAILAAATQPGKNVVMSEAHRSAIHRKVLERGIEGPNVIGPTVCTIPPSGWSCTRVAGHDGPCAAVPPATRPTDSGNEAVPALFGDYP